MFAGLIAKEVYSYVTRTWKTDISVYVPHEPPFNRTLRITFGPKVKRYIVEFLLYSGLHFEEQFEVTEASMSAPYTVE